MNIEKSAHSHTLKVEERGEKKKLYNRNNNKADKSIE